MNKVIFTIFAGRQRYLEILTTYTDILLKKDFIQEVHFWVYTNEQRDVNFIKNKSEASQKYKIYAPPNPERKIWGYYYEYYQKNIGENDILIKSDDDIVYIDIHKFDNFINSIDEKGLYFPNIVNNDVCAYFQQKNKMHNLFNYNIPEEVMARMDGDGNPLTTWCLDYNKAYEIHKIFLENPKVFNTENQKIIEYRNRISINFFSGKGLYIKDIFKKLSIYRNDFWAGSFDDEGFFGEAPKILGIPNKINLNLTVVHFQFGPQNGRLLDEKYLNKYKDMAQEVYMKEKI